MAISSPGVGSGLDVSSIVSQLMAIERQPLARLQQQETRIDARISAFGKLQGAISTLQDASRALNEARTWQAAGATSSDAAAVAATTSTGAAAGSYAVQVQSLAQRQSAASAQLASATSTVGSGTLQIQLGTVSGGAFSADAARPQVSISVAAGDSLVQLRDKINAAGAGVSASVVNDGAGVRLMLRSGETGAAQAFALTAIDDDGSSTDAAGLSAFAYDPGTNTGNLSRTQAAGDAAFTIDGLALKSSTNSVKGAIEGVTLELKQAGGNPVGVQVASDTESMKKAIAKFTDAYNAVNSLLADQTKVDPGGRSNGVLQGNSSAIGVQRQLRAVLQQAMVPPAGSTYTRLSDIGIAVQRDGSLATNTGRLDAALADPAKVRALFATNDAAPTKDGFSQRFQELAATLLRTSGTTGESGPIANATDSLQRTKKSLDNRQADMERRLESVQARLLRQYNQLDSQLAKVQSIDFSKLSNNNAE